MANDTLSNPGPLVEIERVKKYFPVTSGVVLKRRIGEVKAVDDVSLTIQRGETLGLVGESGSGKSTLGRCILQLHRQTEGQVKFDGVELSSLRSSELRATRRRINAIFQGPLLFAESEDDGGGHHSGAHQRPSAGSEQD